MKEETATGPSIANLSWWELLGDEELQRLIHIALRENKDLQRAVASIEEFQARAFIARTDYIPQLSATINVPVVRRGGARIRRLSHSVHALHARQPLVGIGHLGKNPPIE